MVATKIGWFALEMTMVGYFLYFGSSAAFALAIAMALIPLVTLPVSFYMRGKIKLHIVADSNIRRGDSGELVVTLENPAIFPVLRMQCRIHTENQLNRQVQEICVSTWLPPGGKREIIAMAGSYHCGRIKISDPAVKLYDCFGMLGIECKLHEAAYMTVQPDTFEMVTTLAPDSGSNDDSNVYSQERPGNDLAETYQIREYVPGDSIRQIHWKLSNKFDRLIVRDPSLPVIQNVLVFWERTGESDDMDIIDAQAEIIVSLCKSLLENSIQFKVGWNDTDRDICVLHEIRNTEELVGIIPRLMCATGKATGVTGAELLLQTGQHALCGHMVYLARKPGQGISQMYQYGHVTMLLAQEDSVAGARTFDAVNYEEQLTQVEI